MATVFFPGYTTARKDLALFLVDPNENPVNAFEITYALFYVDPGPPELEVVLGDPNRIPVNPSVGEYWAALMVPPTAVSGTYRIRWSFRLAANSPVQSVTQEFQVAADEGATQVRYSSAEKMMIDKLRVLLRDQCIGGEETVELDVDGERMVVRMDTLWECLFDIIEPHNPTGQ